MELKSLLRELCAATGVAGEESGAAEAAKGYLSAFGPCRTTPLGSLLCTVCPPPPGGPHVMLDAHLDEIGLIVTGVTDDGFVRVSNCGGVDRRLLPASRVTIHGAGAPVPAVVCSVPPHLQEPDHKKAGKIETFTLDTGLPGEAVKAAVALGDRVTIETPFLELMGDLVSCKSLDNRAGCAAVMRAGELLRDSVPGCGVTVALTTMEEVGGPGAMSAAYLLEPSHAIAVDVSFARCEGAPKNVTAQIGSGAMIGVSPVLSREMSDGLVSCAKRHQIPYTVEVLGGATGTNADAIASTRCGVRTALISIPQRNMHTPAEVVSLADVEAAARLIAKFVRDTFGKEAC